MNLLPKVNLRRTLLIARRDYLGYVKTWGFWISFLMPFLFAGFGFMMTRADIDLSPTQQIAVLDETGQHADPFRALYDESLEEAAQAVMSTKAFFIQDKQKRAEFSKILSADGTNAAQEFIRNNNLGVSPDYTAPEAKFDLIAPPADNLADLLPYLRGETLLNIDGNDVQLGGLILFKTGDDPSQPDAQYWSTNVNKLDAPNLVDRYLRRLARVTYLASGNLSVEELDRRTALAPEAKQCC